MRLSLRISAWIFTALAATLVLFNFFFFGWFKEGAQDFLPASLAFLGVSLGASLSIELQLYSGGLDRYHRLEINRLEREQQLRLAAIDKRLQVHQEAFSILQALEFEYVPGFLRDYLGAGEQNAFRGEYNKNLMLHLCNIWYDSNCFYLDVEVEPSLRVALSDETKYQEVRSLLRSAVCLPKIAT